jgi:hypothetical protein
MDLSSSKKEQKLEDVWKLKSLTLATSLSRLKLFFKIQKKKERKTKLISTETLSKSNMGNYPGERKAHRTSKDYLEFLNGKLGFPQGTLYNLCVSAVKSKVETKEGVKVTYRGVTMRQKRLATHEIVQLRKASFLIEFKISKYGKQFDRVVQVHLDL